MSRKRLVLIIAGVMLSLFMASVEGTVVATAMPTIVGQLGGLAIYSWVFSAYMLTSTTSVPIYGKLSDVYGRRPVFTVAMGLFLVGSVLCGRATTMYGLIAARVVQGLGAGGLMPLAFTIIGDLFTLEERAHFQGLFSGVWGVSSIVGPLLGGFLVDRVSWHWVFYINVAPGLLAILLMWGAWRDPEQTHGNDVVIDYAGAGILSAGVVALLLGLLEPGSTVSVLLLVLALALFGVLVWVERRAVDPMLPLPLFHNRLFAVACLNGVLASCAMFGGINYIPLFVQSVLGTDATVAGSSLMPESLAWVFASLLGTRLLLRFSARSLILIGMAFLTVGTLAMLWLSPTMPLLTLIAFLVVMGMGMGVAYPVITIAVQNTVPRSSLGSATSTLQFCRNTGGTLGVSIMGAVLSSQLVGNLKGAGIDPATVSLGGLSSSLSSAAGSALDSTVRIALSGAIRDIFVIALVASIAAFLVALLAPRGRLVSSAVSLPELKP